MLRKSPLDTAKMGMNMFSSIFIDYSNCTGQATTFCGWRRHWRRRRMARCSRTTTWCCPCSLRPRELHPLCHSRIGNNSWVLFGGFFFVGNFDQFWRKIEFMKKKKLFENMVCRALKKISFSKVHASSIWMVHALLLLFFFKDSI